MTNDWLASALEAHKRGDYAGALRACVRVPGDRASQTRAHAIRAAVLVKLDRPDEALAEIESAIELGSDAVALYKMAARIHGARGDRRAARDWIDRALRQHPSSRELLEVRERIVVEMHLLTGLYDHLELAVTLHPTWTRARERLIAVLVMLGLYEAAGTHLEIAIAQQPHRADLRMQQATAAVATGRPAAALVALDRALELGASPTERALVAGLLVKAGALAKARRTVKENLARAPEAPEARLQAGFFALWQGDARCAENAVRQLPPHTPGRAKLEAAIALDGGRHEAALVAASGAVDETATDAEAHALRAASLFFLAQYEEAHQAALTAAQNSSEWLPGAQLVGLGAQAGMHQNDVSHLDYGEVLDWLRCVVPEITPPAVGEPWPARAVVEASTAGLRRLSGNFTSAMTFVAQPSRVWTPLTPKAPARFVCVRTAKAIQARPWEWVVEAIGALGAVYPGSPYVHTHAAELWLWYGEYARCEAECRKALALTTTQGSRWAWVGLGAALMLQGRHADALDVFAESNRLMEPGGPLLAYRGETLRRCGDLVAARHDLMRALELGAPRVSAWLNLGLIASAEGRDADARAIAAALQARLPELVEDITGDMRPVPSELASPAAISGLFQHALRAMRGNRSSGRITYFLSDGEARVVSGCPLTPEKFGPLAEA